MIQASSQFFYLLGLPVPFAYVLSRPHEGSGVLQREPPAGAASLRGDPRNVGPRTSRLFITNKTTCGGWRSKHLTPPLSFPLVSDFTNRCPRETLTLSYLTRKVHVIHMQSDTRHANKITFLTRSLESTIRRDWCAYPKLGGEERMLMESGHRDIWRNGT